MTAPETGRTRSRPPTDRTDRMSRGPLFELMAQFPRPGRLEWIGLRPRRGEPMRAVAQAELVAGRGILGDRAAQRRTGARQVTLIQAEHLPVLASLLGLARVPPEWLRRNLVVSGINLLALKHRRFAVGDTILEESGVCAPCSRMEKALGTGGYNAMRGHGGITAMVIEAGVIRVGDSVTALAPSDPSAP